MLPSARNWPHGMRPKLSQLRIVVGQHEVAALGSADNAFDVAQYIEHPGYKHRAPLDDIAIFRLRKPIKFNETAQPVRLATFSAEDGTVCVATGWGKTSGKRTLQLVPHLIQQHSQQ